MSDLDEEPKQLYVIAETGAARAARADQFAQLGRAEGVGRGARKAHRFVEVFATQLGVGVQLGGPAFDDLAVTLTNARVECWRDLVHNRLRLFVREFQLARDLGQCRSNARIDGATIGVRLERV